MRRVEPPVRVKETEVKAWWLWVLRVCFDVLTLKSNWFKREGSALFRAFFVTDPCVGHGISMGTETASLALRLVVKLTSTPDEIGMSIL